jgi:hypothetical protein
MGDRIGANTFIGLAVPVGFAPRLNIENHRKPGISLIFSEMISWQNA